MRSSGSAWRGIVALAATFLLALPAPASARDILELDPLRAHAQLQDWGDHFIDPTGQMTAGDVLRLRDGWQPTRVPSAYPVRHGEALWVRFTVPPAPDEQPWYLKLPQPGLDLATLYTRIADGTWLQQASGDGLPIASWALPHLYPVLPLAVSAAEPSYYLLRLQASDGIRAPVAFVTASALSAEQQQLSLVYGVYFGLLVMSAIFALATSAFLRDGAYLALGLWALMAAAAAASAVGITGLHLWPGQPAWADTAPYLLPALAMPPLAVFVAEALLLRERAPRLYVFALLGALAGVAAATGTVLLAGTARFGLMLATLALLWTLAAGLVGWAWYRGDPFARRLALALAPLPVALLLQWPLLAPRGLPAWASGEALVLIALGLCVPASYLLLALRSQERRDHRRRIAQLSEIDPATGLINDVVFGTRMQGLIERASRFGAPSIVAAVDFPNFDLLWKEFGRKRALELLLRLAERLTSIVRQVDTVARVGSARFGLLVEGPLTPARGRAFAAKVIAHCITPMGGLPQGMVVRPRVAVVLVPEHGTDPQQVMQLLEAMLAEPADASKAILIADGRTAAPGAVPPPADLAPAHPATVPAAHGSEWPATGQLDAEQAD